MNDDRTNKKYADLAEKWLNGTITPEEEEAYAQWYNALGNEDEIVVPEEWASDKEAHKQKILDSINRKRQPVVLAKTRSLYKWVAAAAAVLIVMAGTAWVLFFNNNPKTIAEKQNRFTNDIKPGTNAALLHLANGKVIALDTAINGTLSASGDADVVKAGSSIAFAATGQAQTETAALNLLTTPRASQQQLVLADGTQVWLNAESSIRFPAVFYGNTREVEITGEAYFEVAKNPNRPFIVNVNGSKIEVLGTHFNVMAYGNESALETTLLEGSVRFTKGNKQLMLKPGQQSKLSADQKITLVPDADVEQIVAWKNGFQSFNSADIHTIIRQVERWYDVQVVMQGTLPERTFTGEIPRSANLSELLQLLEATNIHFTIDAQKKRLTLLP